MTKIPNNTTLLVSFYEVRGVAHFDHVISIRLIII